MHEEPILESPKREPHLPQVMNALGGFAITLMARSLNGFNQGPLSDSVLNVGLRLTLPKHEVYAHIVKNLSGGKECVLCCSAILLATVYKDHALKKLIPSSPDLELYGLGNISETARTLIARLIKTENKDAEWTARRAIDHLCRSGRCLPEVREYLDSRPGLHGSYGLSHSALPSSA